MALNPYVPCQRPSVGTKGKPVNAIANYYAVKIPDITIYQYDVKISPELDSRDWEKARPIWTKFEEQYLEGCFAVYDGRALAYAPKLLPFDGQIRQTITLRSSGQRFPDENYTVSLVKTKLESKLGLLSNFIDGKIPAGADTIASVQALNILFHEKVDPKFLRIRESFFTHDSFVNLAGGLEIYKGIFQSIRTGVGKLLLNVDTAVAVMHGRGSLLNLVVKCLGFRDASELQNLNPQMQRKLLRVVKGLRIGWTHRGERGLGKEIKIKNVTDVGANQIIFERYADDDTRPTERTNVAEYFQKHHNIVLKYPGLPCVIVQKDNKLPMELCVLQPGQKYSRKLDPIQTAEMIKATCVKPQERLKAIEAGVAAFKFSENKYIKHWNVQVAKKPITIKARLLPPPGIEYAAQEKAVTVTCKPNQPGVWDAQNKKLCAPGTLGSWGIVSFVQERRLSQDQIKAFCGTLIKACQVSGLNVRNNNPPIFFGNPAGNITETLKEAWVKSGNAAKAKPELLVLLVPTVEACLYAELKRIMNCVIGCPSQVLVSQKFTNPKGVGQYCYNVSLKINAKLGGANAFLKADAVNFITAKPTCVIGIDINHPGKGEDRVPSFCAVTGSVDAKATRYSASCRAQANRQEIVEDLETMIQEVLKKFYATSGLKPDRLLIYRDGVSEGQFQQVLEAEVKAIKQGCAALDLTYAPTITFIVCQKRHHTRFFPATATGGDRTGNMLSGLVVDTDVVHPTEFDFYLLSHAGLQGTSRPIHYRVLLDENNIGADELQALTYNLTYLYTKCTRSVSLVPAVMYADQIAWLDRFHYNASCRSGSDSASYTETPSSGRTMQTVSAEEVNRYYAPVKSTLREYSMYW